MNKTSARLALAGEIGALAILERWRARLGRVMQVVEGRIERTDTSPAALFSLPGGCELHAVVIYGAAGSNATAASIDVGTAANPDLVLSGQDVKGNAGAGQIFPRAVLHHGSAGDDRVDVVGAYTESGTPSTVGGPWWIVAFYSVA